MRPTGGAVVGSVVALVLALAFPAAPPAAGHSGLGCGLNGATLEGECYHAPVALGAVGGCDPDVDNEHVNVVLRADASGGRALFLPRAGCGASFPGLAVASPMRLSGAAATLTGTAARVEVVIVVLADNAPVGVAWFSASGGAPLQKAVAVPLAPIPAGTTTLAVTYQASVSFVNLHLDTLSFDVLR